MKVSLKNVNYKQLAIDHIEKLVLGVVALFAFLAVILAPWARETRTPEELSSLADASQVTVRASKWPAEEEQQFRPKKDIGERVADLLTPVDVAARNYALPVPTIWPLYRRQEPIKDVVFAPVEDLEVRADRPILLVSDHPRGSGETAAVDKGTRADAAEDVRVVIRDVGRGGGTSAGARTSPAAGTITPDSTATGTGRSESNARGKGFHAACIVGVVPLSKHYEAIAKSRNESVARVRDQNLLDYVNFELQRQKAIDDPDNPWPADEKSWETVNIKFALEVLSEVADFEDDVVDGGVTDPVLTMPLPQRVINLWNDLANHKRLRDFELSEEGKEQARILNEKLVEMEKQLQAQQPQGVEKGGFTSMVHGVRQLRQGAATNPNAMNELMSRMNVGGAMGNAAATNQLKAKVTAAGQLLLFRYFDFNVAPNAAYRYRVRLELANPNYQLSADQLVGPHVAEGKTRKTDWSNPTNPVVIGDDVTSFLTQVATAQGHTNPLAQFNVYQWNAETGMPVLGEKLKAMFGQVIGGVQKTTILAPPVSKSEKDFTFRTGEILVDAQRVDEKLDETIHKDLALPLDFKGKLTLVDKALIANKAGELETMDPVSKGSVEARRRDLQEALSKAFSGLKDPEKEASTKKDPLEKITQDSGYAGSEERKSGSRKGSALRKSGM